MRESEVHVKSAALNGRCEGVFIEPPQKLAVAGVLCVYRNIRPRVGTSDQFKKHEPERVLSETTWDLQREGRNFRPG